MIQIPRDSKQRHCFQLCTHYRAQMHGLEPAATQMILVKTVALKTKKEMKGAGNMDISQGTVSRRGQRGKSESRTLQ